MVFGILSFIFYGILAGLPLLIFFGATAICQAYLRREYVHFSIGIALGLPIAMVIGWYGDWMPALALLLCISGVAILRSSQSWGMAIAATIIGAWVMARILDLFSSSLLGRILDQINSVQNDLRDSIWSEAVKRSNIQELLPDIIGFGAALVCLTVLLAARHYQSKKDGRGSVTSEISVLFWRLRDWIPFLIVFAILALSGSVFTPLYLFAALVIPAATCLHLLPIPILRKLVLITFYTAIFLALTFSLTFTSVAWVVDLILTGFILIGIIFDIGGRRIEAELRSMTAKKNGENKDVPSS